jgi:soluble lytic murein transglycosylase
MAKLGRERLTLPAPAEDSGARNAFSGSITAQTLRTLFEADAAALAAPLAIDLARTLQERGALDALGDLLQQNHQPRLSVIVGKLALQRGFVLARHAFPTQGVPDFEPLEGSAGRPMVYAVARQESEFNPEAVSHAGARGLMQMMPATAKRTAQAFRVDYDTQRLISDPAYNARLGAAHLGQLLREQSGSHILTFAAYNAGGRRVKEWIAAHGDPRQPNVDPIDWVERIPFSETRNYVQRVMENLEVYRARLGEQQARLHQANDTATTAK